MKALIVIYDKELDPEVLSLLKGAGVETYTKLEGIRGKKISPESQEDSKNNACLIVLPTPVAQKVFVEFENFKNKRLRKSFGVSIIMVPVEAMR